MRSLHYLSAFFFTLVILSSCVSKKKFNEAQSQAERYKSSLDDCREAQDSLQEAYAMKSEEMQEEHQDAQNRVKDLEEQVDRLQKNNTNLLDRLSDLSVISKSGAENLHKTLESLNEQNQYVKELTSEMRVKDSLNLALVTSLKQSLSNVNDEDVQVEVREGVVYISLSDKMLYRSGSSMISSDANKVLSKIAKILNDREDLSILVEGHTDNVPIRTDCLQDNWDLSVKRATSVVRKLQDEYNVNPSRMTAGGRSEYAPKASNDSADGRSLNRRTEIILLPNLDEFFSLVNEATSK